MVINSEELFKIEGALMKNCMAGQFSLGSYYMYIAVVCNKKRVNLQYRKGKLVQAYSKANSPVNEDIFKNAMDILANRFEKFVETRWVKEKYSFVKP